MKAVRILVTPELLAQMMSLPAGSEIVDAQMQEYYVELTITHPSFPEVNAVTGVIPRATPTFIQQPPVVLTDWNIQEGGE